jgi:phosphoribosylaminoimidazole (AIR) synthetase
MYHTLNMGIGMTLIVSRGSEKSIMARLSSQKQKSWVIGEITAGRKLVEIV